MGYTGDLCDVIDYCARSSNCSNRGTCTNLPDRFECTCHRGYTGADCSVCDPRFGAVGDKCGK